MANLERPILGRYVDKETNEIFPILLIDIENSSIGSKDYTYIHLKDIDNLEKGLCNIKWMFNQNLPYKTMCLPGIAHEIMFQPSPNQPDERLEVDLSDFISKTWKNEMDIVRKRFNNHIEKITRERTEKEYRMDVHNSYVKLDEYLTKKENNPSLSMIDFAIF